ncbi:MAG: hypothetical protein VX317_07570 [Verrucomicrobiota bacterium]|nr:hypothetical protein [Verrucomicrobiota bacterium]
MVARDFPIPLLLGIVLLLSAPTLQAIIFFDTGDPQHNRETAPTGSLAGSGWRFQGEYKEFLGTMISPRHFITAIHIGKGPTTFVQKSWFSGETGDRVYYINPGFYNGNGSRDVPGTDLRIFEVYGEFPAYAPLYTRSNEAGRQVVMMGRGYPRGAEVTRLNQTRGWRLGPGDMRVRWGTNTIDGFSDAGVKGPMMVTDFDDVTGSDECQATFGDSGGAAFIRRAGRWRLAGILFSAESVYDTNSVCGDESEFFAAMFDGAGFYLGEDNDACDDWTLITAANDLDESRTYMSRISANAAAIQAIIQPGFDDALKTPLQRFDDWLTGFGVTGGTAPDVDSESDSWPNAVEYLAALDPSAVDEPLRPFSLERQPGKIRFTVRIRLDAAARGLNWEIQGADDLESANYSAVTGLTRVGLVRSLSEGVETIEYEIDQPTGPHMFYRLRVMLGP